jgi:hypothetical protein
MGSLHCVLVYIILLNGMKRINKEVERERRIERVPRVESPSRKTHAAVHNTTASIGRWVNVRVKRRRQDSNQGNSEC